jgi:hypothetical protein
VKEKDSEQLRDWASRDTALTLFTHSSKMSDSQSGIRFLCPVKACCRAFKSKTTWTRHLRTLHPLLKIDPQNVTVVAFPHAPVFPIPNNRHNRHKIQVSPPTSPADGGASEYGNYDFEREAFDTPLADTTEGNLGTSTGLASHSIVPHKISKVQIQLHLRIVVILLILKSPSNIILTSMASHLCIAICVVLIPSRQSCM